MGRKIILEVTPDRRSFHTTHRFIAKTLEHAAKQQALEDSGELERRKRLREEYEKQQRLVAQAEGITAELRAVAWRHAEVSAVISRATKNTSYAPGRLESWIAQAKPLLEALRAHVEDLKRARVEEDRLQKLKIKEDKRRYQAEQAAEAALEDQYLLGEQLEFFVRKGGKISIGGLVPLKGHEKLFLRHTGQLVCFLDQVLRRHLHSHHTDPDRRRNWRRQKRRVIDK